MQKNSGGKKVFSREDGVSLSQNEHWSVVWSWNSVNDFLPAALIKCLNVSSVISLKSIKKQQAGDFTVAVHITEETFTVKWNIDNWCLWITQNESVLSHHCVAAECIGCGSHTRHREHWPQKNKHKCRSAAEETTRWQPFQAHRTKLGVKWVSPFYHPAALAPHLACCVWWWWCCGGDIEREMFSPMPTTYACIVRGGWHFALVPAEGKVS